jgi:hypothetical protein
MRLSSHRRSLVGTTILAIFISTGLIILFGTILYVLWWAFSARMGNTALGRPGGNHPVRGVIRQKIRHQTPLLLHRLKRRNTVFRSPNASGRSRQGEPVRTIQSTPSTNIRLCRPVELFWSGRPMISGAIRSQAASLNTKRSIKPKAASKRSLESDLLLKGNP